MLSENLIQAEVRLSQCWLVESVSHKKVLTVQFGLSQCTFDYASVQDSFNTADVSQIQNLTSNISQVCQDVHDIKLRWLLVTQSECQNDDITTDIQTN